MEDWRKTIGRFGTLEVRRLHLIDLTQLYYRLRDYVQDYAGVENIDTAMESRLLRGAAVYLSQDTHRAWGLDLGGGDLVGIVTSSLIEHPFAGETVGFDNLWVHPDHRKNIRCVCSLLRAAFEEADECGVQVGQARVSRQGEGSCRLYERIGVRRSFYEWELGIVK